MKKSVRNALLVMVIIIVSVVSASGYFLLANKISGPEFDSDAANGVSLDRSLQGLAALDSREQNLSDGDVFNMDARKATKRIDGSEISMYAYNGQIPGPVLKVRQGNSLTVNFTNNLDVDTTVHWHGIRVKNEFDGVPGVTQRAIRPGESFAYRLDFPDAGVYWYHPHVREDYQQELGLYGNIIVQPSDPRYYNQVNREEMLILDDIMLVGGDVEAFSKDYVKRTLMGRFGNVMLLNGKEDYRLDVKKGEKVRFYITDAANARTFNLSVEGQQMVLVGDDSGRYERDSPVDSVVISPGERRIVEIQFDKPGSFDIIHITPDSGYVIGGIEVSNVGLALGRKENVLPPSIRGQIDKFDGYLKKSPDIEMQLKSELTGMMSRTGGGTMSHTMPDGSVMRTSMTMDESGPIEWEDDKFMMNSMSNSENTRWVIRDAKTGKENDDLMYNFKVGDIKKVRIYNDPSSMHPMQHPIHLHGQRFLVLSEDGMTNDNLAWKDTVLVKKGSTVDLLVDFTNPGNWVIHCHIPEHMESGMMAKFSVSEKP
ncbi:multicopper oxidase family protein [Candidatus Nitrosotenuis aquarius]|uniref:multicopper oxidase family protein n=1 Tax=Candidatus Nitrosotenuis aquarius TaxID=1846278 RepID=UPI0013C2A9AC|nr:multicopper oxidase family protein [Candidatus Nitrosotenuis aquarius]